MTTPVHQDPVAVIGMACRLPGAQNLDAFWKMLVEGRSAIRPIPETRFRRDLYYHPDPGIVGKSYCDLAALVDYPEYTADNSVFSERQIEAYDLPHLALCETAVDATRMAGIPPEILRGSGTGVYVGHVLSSKLDAAYSNGVHIPQVAALFREIQGSRTLPKEMTDRIVDQVVARVRSRAPNRMQTGNPDLNARRSAELISEYFGLDGHHMVFNAACASSLQALAHAIKAIQLGRCDTAIVGGASFFHFDSLILFSAARSLSKNGSYPFTDDADGLIVGEGYITFVLKRLSVAIHDGNPVFATLPGIGISSDGRGKSLWAPRHEGQIEAVRRAYAAGLDMSAVQYVEAHATSTSLGDRTEILALCEAFANRIPPHAKIPVGSVKRNIGHTLEVAGLAGFLKVMMAMKHEIIPPSVQPHETLNTSIDWDRIPFFVPDHPAVWDPPAGGGPRRAAVEAFGIGGLNVHLVVDQYSVDHIPANCRAARSVPLGPPADGAPAAREAVEGAMAIVGAGLVVPGARSIDTYSQVIRAGTSCRKPLPNDRYNSSLFSGKGIAEEWSISMPEAGVIDDFEYDWKIRRIPPKQMARAAPLQFMVLDAVDQALQQYETTAGRSGTGEAPHLGERSGSGLDPKRVGCVVGTEFINEFSAHLAIGLRLPEIEEILIDVLHENGISDEQAVRLVVEFGEQILVRFPAILDETGSFTASSLATRITKTFGFMGGGLAVDSPDPSFAALICCSDLLRTHACDLTVCVAAQQSVTPEAFQILELSGQLAAPCSAAGPQTGPAGTQVPGEGCIALVLKRLDETERAGDRILGVIRGLGRARGRSVREASEQAVSRAAGSDNRANRKPSIVEVVPAGTLSDYTGQLQGIEPDEERIRGCQSGTLSALTSSEQFGLHGAAAGLGAVLKVLLALEGNWEAPVCWRPRAPAGTHSSAASRAVCVREPSVANHPEQATRGAVNVARPGNHSYHYIIERGDFVTPDNWTEATPEKTEGPRTMIDGFVHFDATAVRRARMRAAATKRRAANLAAATRPAGDAHPAPASKGDGGGGSTSPLDRPGTISLAPMISVALSPSPRGPTVPAAQPQSAPSPSQGRTSGTN